jgi:3-isopropylmalate/(R)-2-methylmalate dehydratase large subunit
MDQAIRFEGRILFLSSSAEAMRRQLGGEDLMLEDCLPLRDSVSTDEITLTTVMLTYDERLGRYAYLGFEAGGTMPIGVDAVRNGGFAVTVAGKRYGKGSSRESSPLAEKAAGIRLIVAENFERIYRQNCDNIGILTTTDFSVLDRTRAGEAIPARRVPRGRDALTQDVIRAGGLLQYSKAHLTRLSPPAQTGDATAGGRPMTLAEKIVARKKVLPAGDAEPGDGIVLAADWRFSHDYFTGMCAHIMHGAFGTGLTLERPDQIIAFQDHMVLADESFPHVRGQMVPAVRELHEAHRRFATTNPVRHHGQLPHERGAEGICHAIMAEGYALPGQVVIGTTRTRRTPERSAPWPSAPAPPTSPTAGSPASCGAGCRRSSGRVHGPAAAGVVARDIVQELLRSDLVRSGGAIGMVFEFAGPAVKACRSMSVRP